MATRTAIKAFFTAVRARDLAAVTRALDADPALAHVTAAAPPKKDDGQSPLQVAFKVGAFDVAAMLLDRGADPDFIEQSEINAWRAPALHDALRAAMLCPDAGAAEAIALVRRLLALGADPGARDSYGNSCLGRLELDLKAMAAMPGRPERALALTVALLEAGADPDAADPRRPAADASARGFAVYRTLAQAELQVRGEDTDLLRAVRSGDIAEVVRLTTPARDHRGRTALMHAVIAEQPAVVEALLERGAEVNAADHAGWSALALAWYSLPLTAALLAHGADPNQAAADGLTPFARTFFRREQADLMLAHGADPATRNAAGQTLSEARAR